MKMRQLVLGRHGRQRWLAKPPSGVSLNSFLPRRLLAIVIALAASSLSAAEPISQVLPCGKVGIVGGLGAGVDLQRQMVDTRRFPEAVCNDGTPAVFYFARYTKEEDRDKWVIFLQGGGLCSTAQACANRWCSFDTSYGMDKMTTSLSKASIRGNGFLDPRADNRFGSWNRVLIYYCSSDGWTGTSTKTAQATGGGKTVEFNINFRGSRIVDAVLETLRYANLGRTRAVRIGQQQAGLPDLDNATEILFGGSSAGGRGAIDNADRVNAKLHATNPNVVFRVVIDAIFDVDRQNLDWTKTTLCAEGPNGCSYELAARQSHDQVDGEFYAAIRDESCLTWHAAHAPGTEWRCADSYHEVTNHVTTPMFVHMDEQDENIGGDFVETGFGTASDFGTGIEQQLRALATLNATAEEKGTLATPGTFGPQCTDHESFANDQAVFDVRLGGLSYHDTVWNWWSGGQPQTAIHTFSGPGKAPGCP